MIGKREGEIFTPREAAGVLQPPPPPPVAPIKEDPFAVLAGASTNVQPKPPQTSTGGTIFGGGGGPPPTTPGSDGGGPNLVREPPAAPAGVQGGFERPGEGMLGRAMRTPEFGENRQVGPPLGARFGRIDPRSGRILEGVAGSQFERERSNLDAASAGAGSVAPAALGGGGEPQVPEDDEFFRRIGGAVAR